MALEGNLSAFGLSEILQLIAVQQKSGMLSVTSENGSMVVFFRNGTLISTRDRRRRGRDPLRDYFTRYGVLSKSDLSRLMNISEKSKLDMTEIIVSENFLSEDEMRKHYRAQIQEAIHEILSWQQCSYKFIPSEEIIKDLKIWGEFNIEGILMESMRRIDELPGILSDFPHKSLVVYRKSQSADDSLTANEQAVFALLAEERAIDYLISQAKMPEFETFEALKRLKEKGIINTHADPSSQAEESSLEFVASKHGKIPVKKFFTAVLVFILFSLSMFSGAKTSIRYLKHPALQLQNALYEQPVARNRMAEKLHWIIESYRVEHGHYPAGLSNLQESKFVSDQFMEQVRSFSFRYHLTPDRDTFTLL
ncbi:MAG: DUF4388 domain-containing protein [Candidatus Latescibacterota bacterium]